MNYILSVLMLLTVLPTQLIGMYTTFFKPTYWPEKPRFDRMNMTSYELTYSYTWASKSFDKNGNKVPLLAFANPEPLLPSFLNPKINPEDNKPIAYAIFDGKFTEGTITHEFVQNLHQNFFIQANFSITQSYLKNISITPTNACGIKITPDQKIDSYIEKLSSKLFEGSCNNTQIASIIGPSFLLFGFTKSFTNFNHLDLLDFEFKTGIVFPVLGLNGPDFNLYPRTELKNFAVPFQLKFMIGAYDWLNFGAAGTVAFHFKKDHLWDINENPYPNKLLIPTKKMATVYHHPFITFSTYFEGDNFLPHWTWYVGFHFVKQYKTVWNICSGTKSENYIANHFPAQLSWQQGTIMISSEIDFSSEEKKLMPRCKIVYIKRLFGKSCFDSSVFAGQFGFEILYDF